LSPSQGAAELSASRDQLKAFIEGLAERKPGRCVFNQYSYENPGNTVRRENLLLYLRQMTELNPKMLLVGEAPGYRGCRLTGVPFTSEYILLNGVDRFGLFGESRGYRKSVEFERTWKEPTATIVWGALREMRVAPLLWNAFPFHPFRDGDEQSNRSPGKSELELGKLFLKELLRIFDIERVIALGNKAEVAVRDIGVACRKLRHPAHEGKLEFGRGLGEVSGGYRHQPRLNRYPQIEL
jgi:hypothetical protein